MSALSSTHRRGFTALAKAPYEMNAAGMISLEQEEVCMLSASTLEPLAAHTGAAIAVRAKAKQSCLNSTGKMLFDFVYAKLLANFVAKKISKLGVARHCAFLACQGVYKY